MRGLIRTGTTAPAAKQARPPQRSIDAGWRPFWASGGQPRRVKHLLSTYGGSDDAVTWVYACISYIAAMAASYERQIREPDGTIVNPDELPEDLAALLARPNRRITWFDFVESAFTDLETVGNSIWLKNDRNPLGQPTSLLRLRPDRVQVVPTDDATDVYGYVYLPLDQAIPMTFYADEVIHYRYPNPLDDFWGMGTVEAIIRAVTGDLAVSDHVSKFFANGARISGVLTVSANLGEEQFERLRRQFVEEYAGSSNAFKMLIAEQGMDFRQTSAPPADLAVTEVRHMSKDEILTGFGLPEFVLGGSAQGGVYKMEEAQNIAASSMNPRVRRFKERTTIDLTARWESLVLELKATNNEPRSTRIQRGKDMVGSGASWNEAREEQGLPTIDHPDADRIVLPSGELAPVQLSAPRKSVARPNRRRGAAGKGYVLDGHQQRALEEGWEPPVFPEGMEQLDLGSLKQADPTVARVLVEHQARILRRGVPLLQTTVRGFFRDQQARLLRQLYEVAGGKASRDWGFDDIWSDREEDQALLDTYMPIADALGEDAIEVPARVVDSDLRWDVGNPIIRALRDLLGLLIRRVNETTRKAVGEQVDLGLRRGYSVPQIANGFAAEDYDGIAGVMDEATAHRAETIARSETAMLLNRSATAAYDEAGVDTVEVLDGTQSDDDCRRANGSTWTVEDAERNPIGHPNCVRTFVPIL